jgi:hypothetical protein
MINSHNQILRRFFWFVLIFVLVSTLANWAFVLKRATELQKFDTLIANVAFAQCENASTVRDLLQKERTTDTTLYAFVLSSVESPELQEVFREAIAARQDVIPKLQCVNVAREDLPPGVTTTGEEP